MKTVLNDVHSQLNATAVAKVERPLTLEDLQQIVQRAAAQASAISIGGGRHAMGGQAFLADATHIDMTGLAKVLHGDVERGLLQIEAGALWPAIIAASHALTRADGSL